MKHKSVRAKSDSHNSRAAVRVTISDFPRRISGIITYGEHAGLGGDREISVTIKSISGLFRMLKEGVAKA